MTNTVAFDVDYFKQVTRAQWDRHAKGWNDHSAQIGEWLHVSTNAMLNMAAVSKGSIVLDVAAGAGEQTLAIAARIGPTGSVLATDLSPAIVALAKANAEQAGFCNVLTRVTDGESLNVPQAGFDAAICRLGLMLFPNPAAGVKEMFTALKSGGRACAMVFSTPAANPCIAILVSTAFKHAGLPPPDPNKPGGLLSLGTPGLMDLLFQDAGFAQVATTRVQAPFRLPSVLDYLDFIRTSAGPIMPILDNLDARAREAAWDEITERLDAYSTGQGWEGPNELLLTVGSKP